MQVFQSRPKLNNGLRQIISDTIWSFVAKVGIFFSRNELLILSFSTRYQICLGPHRIFIPCLFTKLWMFVMSTFLCMYFSVFYFILLPVSQFQICRIWPPYMDHLITIAFFMFIVIQRHRRLVMVSFLRLTLLVITAIVTHNIDPSNANYFRGGLITWTPVPNNTDQVSVIWECHHQYLELA